MSELPISLIHPTGNPNVRNAAVALHEAGVLREVITTITYNPSGSLSKNLKLLPTPISKSISYELGRRSWALPSGVAIKTHPWQETIRMILLKTGISRRLALNPLGVIDWVYASLDHHVAQHHLQGLAAVYAYEDGAATTFEVARQQGILCLYDLPIVFYRTAQKILREETENFPSLAAALQAVNEPAWKLARKEKEIQLANHTFVPSSIVRDSLIDIGVKSQNITVIPFGAPIDYFYPQVKEDKIFRVLFVGRVTPIKGVHYLIKAWQKLKLPQAELMLVGNNQFPDSWMSSFINSGIRYVPSVPHAFLNRYYSSANVLVCPSLVEGLALVQLEAMACGVPIIATPNAGACDIISDGIEGFIIPIRDPEAIAQKLEWCYRHPVELAQMGRAARRKAEQLTWEVYRQKLANQVRSCVAGCC